MTRTKAEKIEVQIVYKPIRKTAQREDRVVMSCVDECYRSCGNTTQGMYNGMSYPTIR
jgi:hypothetical protein